jgi:hypothetical protein
MKANVPGVVLFTIAGSLYSGSPWLEAFQLIPDTPESPPVVVTGLSTIGDSGFAYDAIGDPFIDVRHDLMIVAPST